MSARPNWQRQGGFASLMQEITPGMNASDAPSVDELLLVAEGSVEFLFGTSRAALLQISSPLSTSESKAWLSSQNVDAKLAKLRGGWVQEVASAAAAVVMDAEIQTDVKIIGRAYALQAAQFVQPAFCRSPGCGLTRSVGHVGSGKIPLGQPFQVLCSVR